MLIESWEGGVKAYFKSEGRPIRWCGRKRIKEDDDHEGPDGIDDKEEFELFAVDVVEGGQTGAAETVAA
jgi:hypothetical protein